MTTPDTACRTSNLPRRPARLWAAVFAAAAVLALSGCSSRGSGPSATVVATSGTATTSVASSPSSAPKVGSTLRITDPGYGAVILVTVSPPSPAQPSQYATVKGTLQAVTVTIHTVSGTFGANPLYFSARTAAGDSMNADLGGTDNQLATADVAAGQKLRGPVAFDVPKGQTIALIVMAAPFGSQMGTWTA